MWIKIPRGNFEDLPFANEKEVCEFFGVDSIEDARGMFYSLYSQDEYWFLLHTYDTPYEQSFEIGTFGVSKSKLREPTEDERVFNDTIMLNWLIEAVAIILDEVEAGVYNNKIKTELPLNYRCGVIKRKVLWGMYPQERSLALRDLSEDDISDFCKRALTPNKEPIRKLTFGRYFDIVKLAYQSIGLPVDDSSSYTAFKTYADDRDGKICKALDFDSHIDFIRFETGEFSLTTLEWKILTQKGGLQLLPTRTDGGYKLLLRGKITEFAYEIVKVFLSLSSMGIPVCLDSPETIISYLKGEDEVGIVPITELAKHYSFSFPKRKVKEYRYLQEFDAAIIDEIEWIEPEGLYFDE